MKKSKFYPQVVLLLDVLPYIAKESCFALKAELPSIYFSIEDNQIKLGALESTYGSAKKISESKTSYVVFDQAHGPCENMYFSAHLLASKVSVESPILSVKNK